MPLSPPPWATPRSLTVVVCAYTAERWTLLSSCLSSLREQDPRPDQIVLVVDHNDELLARSRAAFGDEFEIIANQGRRGLSSARNTGVGVARGDIVAFVDDDATPQVGWSKRLMDAYDPTTAGVGGSARPIWESGDPRWFPAEFLWVVGCTWAGQPRERSRVRNFIGANMSLRRSVLLEIGGFRDGIGRIGRNPVGGEETEICIRISQTWPTCALILEPSLVVDHSVPSQRASLSYFVHRCWAEGTSKALVSRSVGHRDGLAEERSHAARVLPRGVARGLRDAMHGDPHGLARAAAILCGLAVTTAGFLVGSVRRAELASLGPSAVPSAVPSAGAGDTKTADAVTVAG